MLLFAEVSVNDSAASNASIGFAQATKTPGVTVRRAVMYDTEVNLI
jgi:hypothetical protein